MTRPAPPRILYGAYRRRAIDGARHVRGTNIAYSSVREWLALVYEIGSQINPSTRHYQRCAALYGSLGADDLRDCRDLGALEACERLFAGARGPCDVPAGHGLQRELTRADIGALLVETRNRIAALRSGRADRPRPKGPRFAPAVLPDRALDRLIQRHPDLAIVEQLRAEKRRRQALAAAEAA
jgi:hypothetical protein